MSSGYGHAADFWIRVGWYGEPNDRADTARMARMASSALASASCSVSPSRHDFRKRRHQHGEATAFPAAQHD